LIFLAVFATIKKKGQGDALNKNGTSGDIKRKGGKPAVSARSEEGNTESKTGKRVGGPVQIHRKRYFKVTSHSPHRTRRVRKGEGGGRTSKEKSQKSWYSSSLRTERKKKGVFNRVTAVPNVGGGRRGRSRCWK